MSRVGYLALLRGNRRFRVLWLAELITFLGDWFNIIALYAIVSELSGSGRAMAGVTVAKMLPVFLVTPLAGPLVDRCDRRRLLILMDVGRAVLALGLIVAHRAGSLTALYACIALMMTMTGVFFPARSAAIPQLTSKEELATANALSGGTWSVMLAFGAALGGWVTAKVGVDLSLALDSGTFVLSALLLLLLPALPAPAGHEPHADRSFAAGVRHLLAHRRQLALVSLKPLMALGGAALVMIPLYGTVVYPETSGPLAIGLLFSARGLGALVGSVGLIRLFGERSRTLRRLVLVLFPVAGLAYLGAGRAPNLASAALGFFLAAVASGGVWVMSGTLLQRHGDPRFLGRMFAVEFGTMTLVISATGWLAGTLVDTTAWTPRDVTAGTGWLLFVPALIWGAALARGRRRPVPEREAHIEAPAGPGVAPEIFEAAPAPEEEPDA